jgi:hypothetical protein
MVQSDVTELARCSTRPLEVADGQLDLDLCWKERGASSPVTRFGKGPPD